MKNSITTQTKITFTNSFHGTQATMRVRPGGEVSREQVTRLESKLCAQGCTCSGIGGTRQSAYDIIMDNHGALFVIDSRTGDRVGA